MVQLTWKSALVTGSSRGIGRGIARKLAAAGTKTDRRQLCGPTRPQRRRPPRNWRETAPRFYWSRRTALTLARSRQCSTKFGSTFGKLDVFVHNARPNPGVEPWFASAPEMTLPGLDAAYRSQVYTLVVGCQACVPLMSDGGRIIGITHAPGARTGSWQPWAAMGTGQGGARGDHSLLRRLPGRHRDHSERNKSRRDRRQRDQQPAPPKPIRRSRTGRKAAGAP